MANHSKDPCCGMSVDAKKAQFKAEHQGKEYNFCSKDCKEQFEKNPSKFTHK